MCKIEDMLWQAGSLNDTSDFHSTFFFDKFADGVEQAGGELYVVSI